MVLLECRLQFSPTGVESGICISNKLPRDIDAEAQGPLAETALDCISVLTTETGVTILQVPAAAWIYVKG